MGSDVGGSPDRASERARVERRSGQALAIQSLGPLTILGGVVWAILQPSRIVFFNSAGKGLYDYLIQAPLLVIGVGLLFALVIAPGLIGDLRTARDAES